MDNVFPFVLSFTKNEGETVTFNRLDGLVHIPNPNNLTWLLATRCTGQSSYKEIRATFPESNQKLVDEIFSLLRKEKLVQDSRTLYRAFHDWSSVPMLTSFGLSDQEIAEVTSAKPWFPSSSQPPVILPEAPLPPKRRSVRSFMGEEMTQEELSFLLSNACSKRTIPSAGGFYASVVYVAALRVKNLKPGLYAYDSTLGSLSAILEDLPQEKVIALLSDRVVETVSVVLFVVCNVDRMAQKYGNRAYRYTLLEAGHIMQNAYLFANDSRIGVCEYGGFLDDQLAKLLGLGEGDEKPLPLISMIAGVKSDKELPSDGYEELFSDLESWMKSRNLTDSVHYALRSADGYDMSVYVAESVKKNGEEEEVQLGAGLTPHEAMAKALAEAYERYASSRVRVDEVSTVKETLDLNEVCPQRQEYRLSEGLSEKPSGCFVAGRRYLGGAVKIPVEQVFYPSDWGDLGPVGYFANSTGVAAHTVESIAVHKAAFELIERDALAVHWYGGKTPERIDPMSCSSWITYRVKALRAIDREVVFLRLTLDLTPVVACIITGRAYPYYVLGSASAASHAEAAEKSLTEAEITLTSFLGLERERVKPEDVVSVDDHGTHAAYLKAEDVSWLLSGDMLSCAQADRKVVNIEEALEALNPALVRLDDPATDFMPVVRVLSEKLLPITFGYGSEHYGHPRLSTLGLKWRFYPALPHPLA